MRTLSGGERNRLLLARLFALPANVLVLDEPTNDLDIDTLELLEELLQDYAGTVFLVSHDRRFLDNVVTSTIAWEGDDRRRAVARVRGRLRGLADAARARARRAAAGRAAGRAAGAAAAAAPRRAGAAAPPARKLSYKEQRELDALPARIEALEAEQKALAELLGERRALRRATRSAPPTLQRAPRADRGRADGGARALGGAGAADALS